MTPPATIEATTGVAELAQDDLTTAYNDAAGRSVSAEIKADLVGLTLAPGVYSAANRGSLGCRANWSSTAEQSRRSVHRPDRLHPDHQQLQHDRAHPGRTDDAPTATAPATTTPVTTTPGSATTVPASPVATDSVDAVRDIPTSSFVLNPTDVTLPATGTGSLVTQSGVGFAVLLVGLAALVVARGANPRERSDSGVGFRRGNVAR